VYVATDEDQKRATGKAVEEGPWGGSKWLYNFTHEDFPQRLN